MRTGHLTGPVGFAPEAEATGHSYIIFSSSRSAHFQADETSRRFCS